MTTVKKCIIEENPRTLRRQLMQNKNSKCAHERGRRRETEEEDACEQELCITN